MNRQVKNPHSVSPGQLPMSHAPVPNGGSLQRSQTADTSHAVSMQDRAPPCTAQKTQQGYGEYLPGFWRRGVWPGNSLDLNPVENLWTILRDEVNKMPLPRR